MTEQRRYPQGVPSWVDVETDDVEATTAFYAGLLGWTFTEATPPGAELRYLIAQLEGQDVAGVGGPVPASAIGWNTYIAVDDADAVAAQIEATGGHLLSGPADAGPGGRTATVADPAGVPFRLWQARARLGAQRANEPGAWNFSDLRAADPSAVAPFFSEIFGWVGQDAGFATLLRLPGYGEHLRDTIDPDIFERQADIGDDGSFADAIAWLVPATEGEIPHWHVSITVEDRDAAAAATTRLGGEVLERTDTEWTREARIRDPRGAELTLSQFLA